MVWIYIYKRGNYGMNFCHRGVHSVTAEMCVVGHLDEVIMSPIAGGEDHLKNTICSAKSHNSLVIQMRLTLAALGDH